MTPQPRPSSRLHANLEALRRKHFLVAAGAGAALAVGVSVELLAVMMFLDWWLDLPWWARLIALLVQLCAFLYVFGRFVALPIFRQPDEDELALMVERARPEFRSRLISAIQLARPGGLPPGASAALVEALLEETETLASRVEFTRIVSTERLQRLALLALLVLLMAGVGFTRGRTVCTDLLKRVWLSPISVPRKTRIIVTAGNKEIGRGDAVRLEGFAEGIIPAGGRIEIHYQGRRPQEFTLEPDPATRGRFGRTIENVQESFTYRLRLNDGASAVYSVTTIPRPTVVSLGCDQAYPAYTRLKPVHRSLGDLTLLAGSRLQMNVSASKDIRSASLKLVGTNLEVPLRVDARKPRLLSGEFVVPAQGLTGVSVHMTDTEGMESRDAAVYRVDVLPDLAPVVKLTYPDRKEELVTAQATMVLGFEAADDFEIAHVRLRSKVDTVENGAVKSIDLDLAGERPQRLRRRHEWNIGALRPLLSEGSKIEFWIEAEDNNDITGPGVGASEHQLARVVSESEKREDLLTRAGDYLGSINDVVTDQEKLNRNLGRIILEKASPPP